MAAWSSAVRSAAREPVLVFQGRTHLADLPVLSLAREPVLVFRGWTHLADPAVLSVAREPVLGVQGHHTAAGVPPGHLHVRQRHAHP